MVFIELAGKVIVSRGHVEQGFEVVTDCTVTNLIGVQVGQSLVMVIVSVVLSEVAVDGMLVSVTVEADPVMVIGGQVGQGLYTVVTEPVPGIVMGGQVGQGW